MSTPPKNINPGHEICRVEQGVLRSSDFWCCEPGLASGANEFSHVSKLYIGDNNPSQAHAVTLGGLSVCCTWRSTINACTVDTVPTVFSPLCCSFAVVIFQSSCDTESRTFCISNELLKTCKAVMIEHLQPIIPEQKEEKTRSRVASVLGSLTPIHHNNILQQVSILYFAMCLTWLQYKYASLHK